jgi:MFS family permease
MMQRKRLRWEGMTEIESTGVQQGLDGARAADAEVPVVRRGIARASLAYLLGFSAIGATYPYLPIYYQGFGLSLGQIGALAAAASAVQLVVGPAWGLATDRFGLYRWSPFLAGLVWVAGGIAIMVAVTTPSLVVGVIVLGAGVVGFNAMLDARTLQLLGHDRLRYGHVRMWGSVGMVISSVGTGLAIDRFGPHAFFAVFVPCAVATTIVSLGLPTAVRTEHPRTIRHAWALMTHPIMALFLAGTVLEWSAVEAVNGFLSIHLTNLGATSAAVGTAWALSAAAQVPVMALYPRMAARFGLNRLILAGALVFVVRAFAYVLARDPLTVVLLTTLEGIGFALFICGGVAFVAERAPAHLVATGQGVFAGLTFGLARVIGGAGGGIVAERSSIQGLFTVAGLAGLAAAGVLARSVHPRRGRTDHDSESEP